MSVLSDGALAQARALLAAHDVSGAWRILQDNGDSYADNAAAVTAREPASDSDRLFRDLVKDHWENTVGSDAYDRYFNEVAEKHLENYLRHIEDTGAWPTSTEIGNSYAQAADEKGLPVLVAFDGAWEAALAAAGLGNTWATMLGMEPGRIGPPSPAFEDISPAAAQKALWEDFWDIERNLGNSNGAWNALKEAWRALPGFRLDGNMFFPDIEAFKAKFALAQQIVSPIVLDLDGDGISTTGLQEQTYFDHDANGFAEQTGWISSADGFLVRDLDGNGTIDSGRELFGSETRLISGQNAANGYNALAELDTDFNGWIDAQDAAFASLQIWQDANGDGQSGAGELRTLAEAGVQGLVTTYANVNLTDTNGNTVKQISTFTKSDGSSGETADIWFETDKTYTVATEWLPETPEVAALPDLQGFGNVRDLHQAMLRDSSGNLQNLVQQFSSETDLVARRALMTPLIYAWVGVQNIAPNSRGYIVDARQLYVLEAFLGESFIQGYGTYAGTSNTGKNSGAYLSATYAELEEALYSQLMAQTHLKPLMDSIGLRWSDATSQFIWDVSATVSALQSLYEANPTSASVVLSEFVNSLKLVSDDLVYALRNYGDASAEGFAGELGRLGVGGDLMLIGTSANESLIGDGGNNTLDGGEGNDYLQGGAGNDIYVFNLNSRQDRLLDVDDSANNVDTVRFGSGILKESITARRRDYDLILNFGGNGDELTLLNWGGGVAYRVERFEFEDGTIWDAAHVNGLVEGVPNMGTSDDDALFAWVGENAILHGLAGNDTLYGFTGNDSLDGGLGNDDLIGSGGADTLIGGEGNDRLFGDSDQAAISEHGDDVLDGGLGHDNLRGYAGNDVLLGGEGNDALQGDSGNDLLDGGIGADLMEGGADNDTLSGGEGNDSLMGGLGDDLMVGGAGDDFFVVDSAGDVIVEALGEGDDFVKSSVSLTLGANLERLGLDGGAALNATGNALDNGLWGNRGNNVLTGGVGNDYLVGDAGDDTYVFNRGDGQDVVNNLDVASAMDTLRFGAGITENDVLAFHIDSHLVFRLKGSDDQVTIADHFASNAGTGTDHRIDRVEFAGGSVWEQATLQSVVDRALINRAPTVNEVLAPASTRAGTLFSYTIPETTITDPDVWDSVTYRVTMEDGSPLPGWLQFDPATRTLSGRSLPGSQGSLQLAVWGSDNYGISVATSLALHIAPNLEPVVAIPLADQQINGGLLAYTLPVMAFVDADGENGLTYTATLADGNSLPDWITFDPQTLTFSGAPLAMGTTSVRVTATDDGNLSISDVFDIVVTAPSLAINGTAGNDTLNGGIGNDSFNGQAGNDVLNGFAGDDLLDGAAGNDTMLGGRGDDTYVVDSDYDVVTENANEGTDTVHVAFSYTLGENVENLVLTGSGVVSAIGNALNNVIIGNGGANILDGGVGADTLNGGFGNDTYVVGDVGDVVIDLSPYISEVDTVLASVSYTLSDTVEHITLTGSAAINATGNFLSNTLIGNSAANVLTGGYGNDTYFVQNSDDVIIEDSYAGVDVVHSSVDYALSEFVENLYLSGTAIIGVGNDINNMIYGTGGDNVLDGGDGADNLSGNDGNDTLNGGGGVDYVSGGDGDDYLNGGTNAGGSYSSADTLYGGRGNDTYEFGRGSRFVFIQEESDVAGNYDTVRFGPGIKPSDLTVGLDAQVNLRIQIGITDYLIVRNFFLTQDSQWKVEQFIFEDGTIWTPASIMNSLTQGTAGSDTLTGFVFDDLMDGGAGDDVIYGYGGNDSIAGGAGNDTLYGDDFSETLIGNDTLHGGAGNDSLVGGKGDDTYVFGRGDGIDTISDLLGSDRIALGAGILATDVSLFMDGGARILAIDGSSQTQLLIHEGGSVNKQIEQIVFAGGTTWDASAIQARTVVGSVNAMAGTAGNDNFIVDHAGDTISEAANQGIDSVQTSVSYSLSTNVENLSATGYLNLALYGNGLNNTITGNSGNNRIFGNGGADTMIGGRGDDYYSITLDSTVVEAANEGIDTIFLNNALNYALQTGVENLSIQSSYIGKITLTGNAADNVIEGRPYDIIDGGSGADTMIFRRGYGESTSYFPSSQTMGGTAYVDNPGDKVISDNLIGGAENRIISSIDWVLDNTIGTLELASGSAALNGTGGSANNILMGNEKANVLSGMAGNDKLYGGAGADTLIGGQGNDIYFFDDGLSHYGIPYSRSQYDTTGPYINAGTVLPTATADVAVELANEGVDTIWSIFDTTLGDNIENLSLGEYVELYSFGSSFTRYALNGTGNALNNVINGNGGNNLLIGAEGNDTLSGGEGEDTLVGGVGDDRLSGGGGNDLLIGGNGNDVYQFYRYGGQDVVDNHDAEAGVVDTILFDYGVLPSEITFRWRGSDLVLGIAGTTDELTIRNWGLGDDYRIERVQFHNGTTWDAATLAELTVNHAPQVVATVVDQTMPQGQNWDLGIADRFSDVDIARGDVLSYSVARLDGGELPAWLAFDTATGTFSGTPGNEDVAALAMRVTATDSGALSASADFTLTVANVNDAPIVTEFLADQAITLGNIFGYVLPADAFTDVDAMHGDALTYSASLDDGSLLPEWLSFDPLTRSFQGTPDGGDVGTLSIKVVATDLGGLSAEATFELIVEPPIQVFMGTSGADTMVGSGVADRLFGLEGNDMLDGSGGADTMVGGLGDDTYVLDNIGDVIFEYAGEGTDTVLSSIDYELGDVEENLTLTGSVAILGYGNDLANVLDGSANSAANVLEGGDGDDTYVLGNGDTIVEAAGGGIDTVRRAATYTLGSNLENLVLTGTTAINGTGNSLDNVLTGNSAANTLTGGAGNDRYYVGTGDTVTEATGAGTDTVVADVTWTLGNNLENLILTGSGAINGTGNTLANTLTGNSGNNALSGGTGADTLIGQAGNDTYVIDNVGDLVIEYAGEGTDLVQTSETYSLGAHVENLTITGTSARNGTGNELDNVLTGNSAANSLNGGIGNDTLDGGTGSDTLVGGLGNDTFVVDVTTDITTENANEGIDTVLSKVTRTLGANLENLTLTGTSAINGTGNTLDNVLIGNSAINTLTGGAGNDTLDGKAGADKMLGGAGNDTYFVDVATDATTENANEGTDTVNSLVTWTLGTNLENLTLLGTSAINGTGNTANNTLVGNAGNNTLTGNAGNDTLEGGAGNDSLVGGAGNDTYRFSRGHGVDSVTDNDATSGNIDLASFASDIANDQLWFRHVGSNLEVSIIGTADKFTIANWYSGTANHVEQFRAGNNKLLLDTKVENLVQAMAAFAPPTAGQTSLPPAYQTALAPVLAANWQ